MDDERLSKRIFYGDVTTSAHCQGSQKRRYKDTLKNALKQLQITPASWEDLAQDRPAWIRCVKTSAAIYEANRIAASKTTCPTPTTSVATSDYLPPATSNTTTAPITSDGILVLTYRYCDRSLANPSHRDWQIMACSTSTQQGTPPPIPSLPLRIHSLHGTPRSHAHPRKRNPPRCRHI
ncbi:unnamed protein product [Schistocephalus solidus]|uniref:Uncharacterized protein n=1 Tax=Schistocephalus solidus TaxID=70667 RepID=A0A183SNC3_SCHSO|nr:unnamed protein product [Schistocephalus solidus]